MSAAANTFYDVIVIGGGPAGLTAGIYLARACCRVLVIEKAQFGGQITITQEVVNYPGSAPISGTELTQKMREQAEGFGAEFLLAEVSSIKKIENAWEVATNLGTLTATGLLLATGAHPRELGFAGEKEFRGRGVAYCATCDGEFFTGKEIFVIGGGFAAAEESVFLTRYAKHVTILIRGADFSCAEGTAQIAKMHDKITIHYNAQLESVEGDAMPRVLRWKDLKTGETHVYKEESGDSFGVFVFAGYVPSTALVKGIADIDEHGYVLTDRNQKTSAEGLYAAGDVCVKPLRQVVTATGDGAIAATELEKYIHAVEERTGVRAERIVRQAPQHKVRDTSAGGPAPTGDELFTADEIAQLENLFARMENSLQLEVHVKNGETSQELLAYMEKLAGITDKLSLVQKPCEAEAPFVRVLREDGSWTGLTFHGVPGGHEFTSFVLGLYNAAGPGQNVAEEERARIAKIAEDVHFTILVSLSCTSCPELVKSAQRIATLSPRVTTDVYEIGSARELREKYQVMSVPFFLIERNGKISEPNFGRKNVAELLDILEAS